MPIDRSRYPDNWEAIALDVKNKAEWFCEQCRRPCRRLGEKEQDFIDRVEDLYPEFVSALYTLAPVDSEEFGAIEIKETHTARFVLTVAHLDQNPANNDPSNLKALCSVCHLKHDRPFRFYNSQQKLERNGQLNLFAEPAGNGNDPTRKQPNIFGA